MNKLRTLDMALLALLFALPASAQKDNDDFLMRSCIGVEKKIDRFSVKGEVQYRLRDNWRNAEKWSVGLILGYKLTDWLKFNLGYEYSDGHEQKYSYNDDGTPSKYAKFWRPRHSVKTDLTASVKTGRWKFSLRERWEYNYKPDKDLEGRYDIAQGAFDGVAKTYEGSTVNKLRSRIKVEYDIETVPLTPYVYGELTNRWYTDRERAVAGVVWDINKHTSLDLYYLFQHNRSSEYMNEQALGVTVGFEL